MLSQTSEEPLFQDGLLNMPDMGDDSVPTRNRRQVAPANQAANQTITPANDTALAKKAQLDEFGRWIEESRFIGEIPEVIVAEEYTSGNNDFDLQIDSIVDKFGGAALATFFFFIFKSKSRYKQARSLNPLYRQGKTLATAGIEMGLIFYNLGYLPMILATAIFSLAMGIITVPYWLYRQYYPKASSADDNSNALVGSEGWSKYAKTFLVFGMYMGEVVGNFVSFIMRGDFLRNIAIYGAIGSFATFIAGLIAVPLINKFFNKKLITTKDAFRNNYVRSGITFGVALGSVVGFILGTVAFPGLGSLAGMAMGAAFGSVIGGITLGICGKKITRYLNTKWKVKENTDNSWDYATRNLSYLFGFIGAAIGFFVPVPGGALIGVTLGTAVGGAIGWAGGFFVIRAARKVSLTEDKAKTLPWTQRIANGTMLGSMIGATIGFLIGLAGGPAGAVLGGTLGYSLGATLGGVGYGLYDKNARKLFRHYFSGTTIPAEVKPLLNAPTQEPTPVAIIVSASTPRDIPEKTACPPSFPELKQTLITSMPSSPKITAMLLAEQKCSPTSPVKKIKPALKIDTSIHKILVHECEAPFTNNVDKTPPHTVFFRPHEVYPIRDIPDFSLSPIKLKA